MNRTAALLVAAGMVPAVAGGLLWHSERRAVPMRHTEVAAGDTTLAGEIHEQVGQVHPTARIVESHAAASSATAAAAEGGQIGMQANSPQLGQPGAKNSAGDFDPRNPARSRRRGTQEVKYVAYNDDPMAMQHLRTGAAEESEGVDASMSAAEITAAYRMLTDDVQKVGYLTEIGQAGRSDTLEIYQSILMAEANPLVAIELLALAVESGTAASVRQLLIWGLYPERDVQLRLASLYHAQDHAPDLLDQYVDDRDELVRNDARSMAEQRSSD